MYFKNYIYYQSYISGFKAYMRRAGFEIDALEKTKKIPSIPFKNIEN